MVYQIRNVDKVFSKLLYYIFCLLAGKCFLWICENKFLQKRVHRGAQILVERHEIGWEKIKVVERA